jgi:hypothetical protein
MNLEANKSTVVAFYDLMFNASFGRTSLPTHHRAEGVAHAADGAAMGRSS